MQHPCNKVWGEREPEETRITREPSPDGYEPGSFKMMHDPSCLAVWTGTFWLEVLGAALSSIAWNDSPDGSMHIGRVQEIHLTQHLPDCAAADESPQ